jgi:predicted nuclease of predicted toxin-antitoxin system
VRFLIDECVSPRLGELLIETGHDVTSVSRDYPTGIADETILELAVQEDRIVVTGDLGFGELVVHQGAPNRGVVLLRVQSGNLKAESDALRRVIDAFPDGIDDLVVVDERRIRVRAS